ncbi:PAS domain S-box protein [Marivirga sp.]|uniref:PAS domain S-box protein n=1 Tax=Marivirga sp. TaxID=2018662 RepID=UPI002D80C3A0|nr:PAS domain S-box protein [Marivirga sp.]HET8859653.1 PAS domain S-box protein [Marivirga sp.]
MNNQPIRGPKNKAFIFSTAVGVFIAIIFSVTIIISYQYYQKQKFQQLQSELNLVTENIRKIMTNSNLAAFSVGLTIDPVKDTITNFNYVAREIIQRHPYLFGVQILRKGEIQYVYPYEEHKSVIGYDILKDSNSNIEAQRAIDKREIYYAGPLGFQQGGEGIIGRLPIYHKQDFWGFSAVLIRMEDFLKASGISDSKIKNVSFQLSKINPNSGQEEYFTSNKSLSSLFLEYTFDEAGWKITAYYQQDPIIYVIIFLFVSLALASSIGSSLYTYQLLKKPEKLESLLSEKTKQIAENNEYLTSMVHAIPDLIFIYDKEGRYLDFHAYQQSLLFYKPNEFIGKSTFELFEKEFAEEIVDAIKRAIESKRITENSYYLDFKDGRKYFESRYMAINSYKVLAVVREVTESKLSAQKLQKSEQKYRNLVSQASDAIFLADEKGNLLELNEIGHELTCIPLNIDIHFNLNDIIQLSEKDGQKLTEVIHQNGIILEEAILISLDNKRIPVEISGKITAERQIQGIIRDISVRKNFIKSIQVQNEKLRKIAWIQSHEVRAPLARLLGLLDYLDRYEQTTQKDNAKIIESLRASAMELDVIIRDVVTRTELAENSTS